MRRNVEIVQAVYEAMAAKDAEAILRLSDPAITVTQSEEVPWGGTYEGLADSIGFFHRVTSFLDSQVQVDTLLDGGEYIVVIGRTHGTVRSNGEKFSVPLVHRWQIKEGRVRSLQVLLDNPTMLKALHPNHA